MAHSIPPMAISKVKPHYLGGSPDLLGPFFVVLGGYYGRRGASKPIPLPLVCMEMLVFHLLSGKAFLNPKSEPPVTLCFVAYLLLVIFPFRIWLGSLFQHSYLSDAQLSFLPRWSFREPDVAGAVLD